MKKSAFTLAGRICGSAKRGYRELRKAFTLAEVLITLTIIGVIAAITVPALIQRTNKQEYVTALQKAYSVLSQATNQIIAENGSPKGADSWFKDNITFYETYKGHLNTIKDCGTSSGCFGQGMIKFLNNNNFANLDTDRPNWGKLVLSDGMQIAFQYDTNNCNPNNAWAGTTNRCGLIFVDVNGEKGPNIFGRDFFAFALKENGLYPHGCDTPYCTEGDGQGCACKVLREGAMNY